MSSLSGIIAAIASFLALALAAILGWTKAGNIKKELKEVKSDAENLQKKSDNTVKTLKETKEIIDEKKTETPKAEPIVNPVAVDDTLSRLRK